MPEKRAPAGVVSCTNFPCKSCYIFRISSENNVLYTTIARALHFVLCLYVELCRRFPFCCFSAAPKEKQPLQGCRGCLRLSKELKKVAVGGHAPTTATPTGKFCGKLCARSVSDECAVCRKILSKGIPKGEIAALGNCRARLLPPLQRVEFLDTLKQPLQGCRGCLFAFLRGAGAPGKVDLSP